MAASGAAAGSSGGAGGGEHILRTRTYDLLITYDKHYAVGGQGLAACIQLFASSCLCASCLCVAGPARRLTAGNSIAPRLPSLLSCRCPASG